MGQKKAPPEIRKAQIIEATIRCFQRKGYENTTIDDIAAEYGLSKGSIYCYYTSKKEILLAVFDHLISKLINEYESLVNGNISAREKMTQMAQILVDSLLRDYEKFRPIIVLLSVAYEDEAVREISANLYKLAGQLIKEILHQGEKDGEFKAPNKNVTSAMLIAMGEGLLMRQLLLRDLDIDEIEKEMTIIVDRIFPPLKKKTIEPENLTVLKELIVNNFAKDSAGEWKSVDKDYLEWRPTDVVLRIGLPKEEKKPKKKKAKN